MSTLPLLITSPVTEEMRPEVASLPTLSAQDVEVDLQAHLVRVAGRSVALPPHELRLLATLMRRAGQAVARQDLISQIWGVGSGAADLTSPVKGLEVLVGRLRRRIEPDPHRPRYIRTIRGFGYIFDLWPIRQAPGDNVESSAAEDITGVDEAVRVLADPLRARIVTLLAAEAMCTCHLVEETGAAQTTVSHHLRLLREAQWVDVERCGRFTYYHLRPTRLESLAHQMRAISDAAQDAVGRRRPC
jgi:ArsR family transcriptional regulator